MSKTLGFNTANKRYKRIFWPVMVAYVIIILGASAYIDKETAPVWLKALGALGATIPVVVAIWAIVRQTNETDEYTRARQMKALAEAGAGTACVTFLVGFLQIFEVIQNVEVFWLGPLFFIWFGFARCRGMFGKTV